MLLASPGNIVAKLLPNRTYPSEGNARKSAFEVGLLPSLGIFDKAYAQATAGTTDEHQCAEPDLFTAETPCGTYQGMTDQVVPSRTPGSFRTVLVPQGSSKPEWLL